MKVYLISAKARKTKLHNDIIQIIEKFGHKPFFELVSNNAQEADKTEEFDLMIADIEQASTALGCQIVFALTNKKPVLCLYNEKLKQTQGALVPQRERYAKYLIAKSYNKNTMEQIIKDFLEEKDEQAQNRFNFFVSSDISNYLDWVSFNRQQTRADLIRRLVRDELSKDKQYAAYLTNKNKSK